MIDMVDSVTVLKRMDHEVCCACINVVQVRHYVVGEAYGVCKCQGRNNLSKPKWMKWSVRRICPNSIQ